MFDYEKRVQFLLDVDIREMNYVACHPNINSCSLLIKVSDLLEFFLPGINHGNYKEVIV